MKKQIPYPFGIDEISFIKCFSAPSYRMFIALLIGWVLTVGKHTVSQVILTMRLHDSKHFASIYRFLGKGRWSVDLVSSCLFRVLVDTLKAQGADIQVVIDDTLNKRSGKRICGAGWQHDGSAQKQSKQTGYGVCFVIIGLAVRLLGVSDRMFCLPYAARLWWPPKAKVKPRGLSYRKKPELALELVEQTRSWLKQGERLRLVTDLGYCCDTLIKQRHKDIHITGRLRSDSALYGLVETPVVVKRGRPRKRGPRLPTPAAMFSDPKLDWTEIAITLYGKQVKLMSHQFVALWYHSAGEEAVSIVLCHDPSRHHRSVVFFDTDINGHKEQIIERYSSRWSIEVTNRETKQLLGADEPQCRKELSVIRTPMFAYWAYCLVTLWFVRNLKAAQHLVNDPAPWYRNKKSYTFSDMLAAARRSHFSEVISSTAFDINELQKINKPRYPRRSKHVEYAKL